MLESDFLKNHPVFIPISSGFFSPTEKDQEILTLKEQLWSRDAEINKLKNELVDLEHQLRTSNYRLRQREEEVETLKAKQVTEEEDDLADFRQLEDQSGIPPILSFNRVAAFDRDTMVAYTGMQHVSSLNVVLKILDTKKYEYKASAKVRSMSVEDQVILLFVKLKLDLPYRVLADLFQVSRETVSNVFNSLLSVLYEFFL